MILAFVFIYNTNSSPDQQYSVSVFFYHIANG